MWKVAEEVDWAQIELDFQMSLIFMLRLLSIFPYSTVSSPSIGTVSILFLLYELYDL